MDQAFGRYRLRGLLGSGGMGQVYRGYDTELHRDVAIKVLPPEVGDDPSFEQRFRREARTAAALGEPHVVPIFDSGVIDGRLFIAMQLIDGTDIATLLRGGPTPPERAVSIIEQAAAALDAAHRASLVHRDVKPANLVITANDFVYLIDFGIAHALGDTALTNTGLAVGTLAYLAPERMTAGQVDHRADIYALTCVLYECLVGATPYPATSPEQQMFAHINGPPPEPSRSVPELPVAFDAVIARGMARVPDDRYRTAGELAAAARAALEPAVSVTATTLAPGPGRGSDAFTRVSLDLVECASGITKQVTVETQVCCGRCRGRGGTRGSEVLSCDNCGGRGEVEVVLRLLRGREVATRPCQVCRGAGGVVTNPCSRCGGDGRVHGRREINVKFPAGIGDGMRVRLAEQGEVGLGGGPPGDLYVEVHEQPHETLTRDGGDLHCTVWVAEEDLAQGTPVPVDVLGDRVKVKIAPGTRSGTVLRVKRRGMPKLPGAGGGRGDLFVRVEAASSSGGGGTSSTQSARGGRFRLGSFRRRG